MGSKWISLCWVHFTNVRHLRKKIYIVKDVNFPHSIHFSEEVKIVCSPTYTTKNETSITRRHTNSNKLCVLKKWFCVNADHHFIFWHSLRTVEKKNARWLHNPLECAVVNCMGSSCMLCLSNFSKVKQTNFVFYIFSFFTSFLLLLVFSLCELVPHCIMYMKFLLLIFIANSLRQQKRIFYFFFVSFLLWFSILLDTTDIKLACQFVVWQQWKTEKLFSFPLEVHKKIFGRRSCFKLKNILFLWGIWQRISVFWVIRKNNIYELLHNLKVSDVSHKVLL